MTYLGIDGGGTKTAFLLTDDQLNALCRIETGPSNWLSVGADTARIAIAEGISRLTDRPDVVCGGFAGSSRAEGLTFYRDALKTHLPGARLLIETDALIAYIGAIGVAPGVVLIAGTGSIAAGRRADGTMIRAGGWGPQFSDEGSGFWIGREAVRAALGTSDAGEEDRFAELIAQHLGLASIRDVIAAWNSGQIGVPHVAGLFPEIVRWYPAHPAGRILTEAALHLRRLTQAALKRVGVENCAVSFSGSVASHPLMRKLIGIDFQEPQHSPEWGAIIWAREHLADAL